MKVELHSEKPDEPLRPTLLELTKDATNVEIAVAFVTKYGVKTVNAIIKRLKGQATARLIASVLFPTDLDALAELAKKIEVHVHLGYDEHSEKLHGQFHSKIIMIEREEQSTIIVGSHNWTENGLDGGNLEASMVVECQKEAPIEWQAREHINHCRSRSELFDVNRMALYQEIQRRFHPKVRASETQEYPGFERSDGLVILAEADSPKVSDTGELVFSVPDRLSKQYGMKTNVLIFVFPRHALFGKSHPFPAPLCFRGRIVNNDDRESEEQIAKARTYFIRDMDCPFLEKVRTIPSRTSDEMQVVIAFERISKHMDLPLFHTADQPQVSFKLISQTEHEVYSSPELADHCKTGTNSLRDERFVPTGILAEVSLKVPFLFAYPHEFEKSLEEYGFGVKDRLQRVPIRIKVTSHKSISRYVSFVKYMTKPVLTKVVHSTS